MRTTKTSGKFMDAGVLSAIATLLLH